MTILFDSWTNIQYQFWHPDIKALLDRHHLHIIHGYHPICDIHRCIVVPHSCICLMISHLPCLHLPILLLVWATRKTYITQLLLSYLQISTKFHAACKTSTVPSAPKQNCLLPVPCILITLLLKATLSYEHIARTVISSCLFWYTCTHLPSSGSLLLLVSIISNVYITIKCFS